MAFCQEGKSARNTLKYRGIYIPPKYNKVRAACSTKSRLQAKATDKAGKEQYFYSKTHKKDSEEKKWSRMREFSNEVDYIREDIQNNIHQQDLKKRALGTAFLLIDNCNFRIGSASNKNVTGVTTIKAGHITPQKIEFVGKSGKINSCDISLTHLKKNFLEHKPTQFELNDYLKKFGSFTCKDFRTFNANESLISTLFELQGGQNPTPVERKQILKKAIAQTAKALHHTPAICKSSYLYPKLLQLYLERGFSYKASRTSPDIVLKSLFQRI